MILSSASVLRVQARLVRRGEVARVHRPKRLRMAMLTARAALPAVRRMRLGDPFHAGPRADTTVAVLVGLASVAGVFGEGIGAILTVAAVVVEQARREGWRLRMPAGELVALVAGTMVTIDRGMPVDYARLNADLGETMEPIARRRVPNPARSRTRPTVTRSVRGRSRAVHTASVQGQ